MCVCLNCSFFMHGGCVLVCDFVCVECMCPFMHEHAFVHMHIGCFPGQCPPHNEGQTIEKMISILVDPVADRLYSSLSSRLCFPSPPFSVGSSWLRSCSKHRQAGCKRILQCGITMATATVSDIHNTESGTVDPWDRNSRLGYPLT